MSMRSLWTLGGIFAVVIMTLLVALAVVPSSRCPGADLANAVNTGTMRAAQLDPTSTCR